LISGAILFAQEQECQSPILVMRLALYECPYNSL
jgi:hypothetical protein